MYINKIKNILAFISVILFCIFIFYLGKHSVDTPKSITKIKWDTVSVEKPIPYKVETTKTEYRYLPKFINIPIIVDGPRIDSTNNKSTEIDSIQVSIQIERKIYQDERYKAIISGPKIGDLSPNLDALDIYTKTETKIIEKPIPFMRPYVSICGGQNIIGIGGGISIKQKIDIGAKYIRFNNNNSWLIEANYRF